jgi:stalled ribosome alternative rescue factor ArfA
MKSKMQSKQKRRSSVAREVRSPKYRIRIVEPKKGKGSYNRKDANSKAHVIPRHGLLALLECYIILRRDKKFSPPEYQGIHS